MEYTYQPNATSRPKKRPRRRKKLILPSNSEIDSVKEIVLGNSLFARIAYWVLLRTARTCYEPPNVSVSTKISKVTRSDLRQNKKPVELVSVVVNDRSKRLLRGSKTEDVAATERTRVNGRIRRIPKSIVKAETHVSQQVTDEKSEKGASKSLRGVSEKFSPSKKILERSNKKFEQDLFVKTERNIAAAMMEARKGISAEQLVIRFGLSVPEAGLIAGMRKHIEN